MSIHLYSFVIWRFPKTAVPPNHYNFKNGFSMKQTIQHLGYHHFKTPPSVAWPCLCAAPAAAAEQVHDLQKWRGPFAIASQIVRSQMQKKNA